MDLGTGIAIAGVWLFPSACALSRYISNFGWWLSTLCATAITIFILIN